MLRWTNAGSSAGCLQIDGFCFRQIVTPVVLVPLGGGVLRSKDSLRDGHTEFSKFLCGSAIGILHISTHDVNRSPSRYITRIHSPYRADILPDYYRQRQPQYCPHCHRCMLGTSAVHLQRDVWPQRIVPFPCALPPSCSRTTQVSCDCG